LLSERRYEGSYSREGLMLDFAYAYAIPLTVIPLLAVIACFVVTWIWGD